MDEENRAIPCLIHIFFRILILTLIFGRILINNGLNFCRENIVFEINISEPFSSSNKVNRRSSSSTLFPPVEFFPCQLLCPTSPVDRLFNLYLYIFPSFTVIFRDSIYTKIISPPLYSIF